MRLCTIAVTLLLAATLRADATWTVQFPDLRGVPAVVVSTSISALALRMDVGPTGCAVRSTFANAATGSVRVLLDGRELPSRLSPDSLLTALVPVTSGASVKLTISPGSQARPKQLPSALPLTWQFRNDFYSLSLSPAGFPIVKSRLGGQELPLAENEILYSPTTSATVPLAMKLESVRLLLHDDLGDIVEVTQRGTSTGVKLVSTYECYPGAPYFTVRRSFTNEGAADFVSLGWFYDRYRVTPGGAFERAKDFYTERDQTVPYADTWQWPWGTWGGQFTDASEKGKAGLGLLTDAATTLDGSSLLGANAGLCIGGWSPDEKTGLLYLILGSVRIPPGQTLTYRTTALVHAGDPDATRGLVRMTEKQSSWRPSVEIADHLSASTTGPLMVATSPDAGVIGVRSPWFECCFAADKPSLEWLRLRSPGVHYRWDGTAEDGWSGYVLRLAPGPLPLAGQPGDYPDTGKRISQPPASAYRAVQSPYTITWPGGKATVLADGTLRFEGMPADGELSTLDLSQYRGDRTVVRECLGGDMPEVAGKQVSAFNPSTGLAIWGDMKIEGGLIDDALTPSLERRVTIGRELHLCTLGHGAVPSWLAPSMTQPKPPALATQRLGDATVRLASIPADVIRLYPTRDKGYEGRPLQLGVNPMPVKLDLDVACPRAQKITFRVEFLPKLVTGLHLSPTDHPRPDVTVDVPAGNEARISIWVTLAPDTFGRFTLPLTCEAPGLHTTLAVPIAVRLQPLFGTWVYFRKHWENTSPEAAWHRFPEDLTRHRVNTIMYQKEFAEYFTTGHPDFTSFDRDVASWLDTRVRLIISADHWGTIGSWDVNANGPMNPSNPKWANFVKTCYGELMPRYDKWPHVICWYNFDECGDPSIINFGYDTSIATGITRPVHSLFMRDQSMTPEVAALKADVWHCDPYTEDINQVTSWAEWSHKRFPERNVWVTLSGHWGGASKWRCLRQQAMASYRRGLEGFLYWMYLESPGSGFGLVYSGPLGPITSARWESARETGIDLEFAANIDYLLATRSAALSPTVAAEAHRLRDEALADEEALRFHSARTKLEDAWGQLVRACKLEGKVVNPLD